MKKLSTGYRSVLALTLALLMILPCLAACSDTGNDEKTEPPAGVSTTVAPNASSEAETTRDSLPELDFGGESINILYWEDANNNEFYVEQTDGSEINDVVYRRNENVQERLNIRFAWNGQKGAKAKRDSFMTYVRTGIDSGENIELIAGHSMVMGGIAAEGYLSNLGEVEHIDLTAPWWPKDLVENSTIHGNIFFLSGDISLNTLLGMESVFFNKDMTDSDLYGYVHNKTWTIDKMFEESKNSFKDTTGNGKSEDDTFGFVTYSGMINALCIGMGIRITDKDEAGMITISDTYVSEKTQGIIELLNANFYNTDAWYYTSGWSNAATVFGEGRTLFTMASVRFTVNELSSSDVRYGILPAPLYNSDQDDYHTLMANTYTMYGLAHNCKESSRAGAVIEAMASEGYHTVTPVVFEVALKARYSDDSADSMMFDKLRSSVVMEIGLVFSDEISGGMPSKALFTLVSNKRNDWMSYMKQYETKIDRSLKDLNESFDK